MIPSFNIVICSNNEPSLKKVGEFLIEKKYSVYFVQTEDELRFKIKNQSIQLVILELDFKDKDAISMTSEIRSIQGIRQPFIVIFSDKNDDYIQITAFNAGADDFLVSPIKPILLEAKFSNFKKRCTDTLIIAPTKDVQSKFFIDKEQYLVLINNEKISLPRKEFEMLNFLYQNKNKVITRQDFAKTIWKSVEIANSRIIDIHIRNIRRILKHDVIKTVKGIGYIFNMDTI